MTLMRSAGGSSTLGDYYQDMMAQGAGYAKKEKEFLVCYRGFIDVRKISFWQPQPGDTGQYNAPPGFKQTLDTQWETAFKHGWRSGLFAEAEERVADQA